MDQVGDQSFSLNIRVLRLIGLYPTDSFQNLHKVYACTLYASLMVPVTIFSIIHFVFAEDFTNFKYNDFIMVGMIFYTFKFFPCLIRRNEMKLCVHYFDNRHYYPLKEEHKKILEKCIAICKRNTNIFFWSCVTAGSGFVGQALVNLEELPLNVWVPKVVKEKSVYYYPVHFLLLAAGMYAAIASSTIDTLISGLCCHAAAQVEILRENLQNLDYDVTEQFDSLCESTECRKTFLHIRQCILHHQAIQNFVHEYQNCFSFVVFSQFAGSSLVIAILCFQLSKAAPDLGFFVMINDLIVALFQIVFYCYYGTLLVEENSNISDAIYMGRWYEYDMQCKKSLMVLIEYSKKPMIITVGKLLHLSLDTFTMILRRAYSLLAVLKNY